ncbi:MAG: hypothetical protein NTW21_31055 [Verrucomicrobia bacterium]|nr:hypothetical protein [Verrucomicrobiota bacterium]
MENLLAANLGKLVERGHAGVDRIGDDADCGEPVVEVAEGIFGAVLGLGFVPVAMGGEAAGQAGFHERIVPVLGHLRAQHLQSHTSWAGP